MNAFYGAMASYMASYIVFVLAGLISLTSSIFACLLVVKDCEINDNPHKAMWGVLVFFFTFIAGIIYLFNRRNYACDKYCTVCGKPLKVGQFVCDACHSTSNAPIVEAPEKAAKKKTRKSFFIVWLITLILSSVVYSIASTNMVVTTSKMLAEGLDDFSTKYSEEMNDILDDIYDDDYDYDYDDDFDDFDLDDVYGHDGEYHHG